MGVLGAHLERPEWVSLERTGVGVLGAHWGVLGAHSAGVGVLRALEWVSLERRRRERANTVVAVLALPPQTISQQR